MLKNSIYKQTENIKVLNHMKRKEKIINGNQIKIKTDTETRIKKEWVIAKELKILVANVTFTIKT